MLEAPIPDDEAERLAALCALNVLDTQKEAAFDELTALAAAVLEKPMALISLVDAERQWFKSHFGIDAESTPRNISFCGHAIHGSELFEIKDATKDARFADNPAVLDDPKVRFYAGQPLVTTSGHRVGTLCVVDRKPGQLSPIQKQALKTLAAQAMRLMEMAGEAKSAVVAHKKLQVLMTNMAEGTVLQDKSGKIQEFNPSALQILGLTANQLLGRDSMDPRWQAIKPDGSPFVGTEHPAMVALRTGKSQHNVTMGISQGDGKPRWININATPVVPESMTEPTHVVVTFADITEQNRMKIELGTFFNQSPDSMCITGLDGSFKRTNIMFREIFGDDSTREHGGNFFQLLGDESGSLPNLAKEKLTSGMPLIDFEHTTRDYKQQIRILSWRVYPDLPRGRLYCTARDITQMKQTQRQFEDAQTIAKIGSWEYDIPTKKIIWSRQLFEFFPADPAVGAPTLERHIESIHPDDRQRFVSTVSNAMATGNSYVVRYRSEKDGVTRWLEGIGKPALNANGEVVHLSGTCQDITERVNKEEENSLLTNALDIGIWRLDPSSGTLSWDESMHRLHGVTPLEFSGQFSSWVRCLTRESADELESEVNLALAGKKPLDVTLAVKVDGQKFRYICSRGKVSRDSDGKPRLLSGVSWDRTAEVVLAQSLKDAHSKTVQSAKMASLGEMAGGIAHEINNPLSIITGNVEQLQIALKTSVPDAEILSKRLQKVHETAIRIAKVIRGLQAFSRNAGNDPKVAHPVTEIVQNTLELCGERFRHAGVDLSVEISSGQKILCRPAEISQVILNLLNNAFDVAKELPQKWVKVQSDIEGSDGAFINITVTDSGHGIPDAVAQKMMQPFFTTKEVGRGTGLGLSISKGLVEEHGGTLTHDRHNGNTRFIVRLPSA